MKIQYIGTKKKLTIGRPFGKETSRCKDKVVFETGKVYEFSDAEGQALLDCDAEYLKEKEITISQIQGLERLENGTYRKQRFFIKVLELDALKGVREEKGEEDGEETKKEKKEDSLLTKGSKLANKVLKKKKLDGDNNNS